MTKKNRENECSFIVYTILLTIVLLIALVLVFYTLVIAPMQEVTISLHSKYCDIEFKAPKYIINSISGDIQGQDLELLLVSSCGKEIFEMVE